MKIDRDSTTVDLNELSEGLDQPVHTQSGQSVYFLVTSTKTIINRICD